MTEFEEAQDLAQNDSKFRAMIRRAYDPIALCDMIEESYDLLISFEEACDLMDLVVA